MTEQHFVAPWEKQKTHFVASWEKNTFRSYDCVLFVFYTGLVALAQQKFNRSRQKLVAHCIKIFKKWSKRCPENFLGKLYFLEAELAATTGNHDRARSKYTSAILLSKEGGCFLQHALANERAGKYYIRRGEKGIALGYLKEALSAYDKWGGKAKVAHLKKEKLFWAPKDDRRESWNLRQGKARWGWVWRKSVFGRIKRYATL